MFERDAGMEGDNGGRGIEWMFVRFVCLSVSVRPQVADSGDVWLSVWMEVMRPGSCVGVRVAVPG